MRPVFFSIFISGILLLQSCSGSISSEEKTFTSGCWGVADSISLSFKNPDTSVIRSLYFPIVFDEKYNYNNLFLKLETLTPSGNKSTQQYQFLIMDESGKWLGKSSRSGISFNLYAGEKIKLTQVGNYRFRLYHFMRDVSLCGINSAGISIGKEK